MNIPDIPEIPQQIITASQRGKFVVFVGSGVSQIVGCPSWKKFAQGYLKYLFDNKKINYAELQNLSDHEPRKVLSICQDIAKKEKIDPKNIKSLLEKLLSPDRDLLKTYSIFQDLYSFNASFVTTNYDENFDNVSSSSKVFYKNLDLLTSNLIPGNILHLHGSVKEPPGMVMTLNEYLQSYRRNTPQADLLDEIFQNRTVLFVGYGLEEFEVLEFMVGKSSKEDQVLQHHMLYSIFNEEEKLFGMFQGYYNSLGITLCPYPIKKNGYEQLATVIKEWAKKIGPESKPENFLERRALIDKVI
jgi:hypothetical protein